MEMYAPRLPAVLGSFAALIVAFVSFLAQVSPVTCVMRAVAAFIVFAAFGIIIRYLLGDAMEKANEAAVRQPEPLEEAHSGNGLEHIPPGTPLAQLLEQQEAYADERDDP
jgi:hypothetical protein